VTYLSEQVNVEVSMADLHDYEDNLLQGALLALQESFELEPVWRS
jgi:hypothetical protein